MMKTIIIVVAIATYAFLRSIEPKDPIVEIFFNPSELMVVIFVAIVIPIGITIIPFGSSRKGQEDSE